MSSSHVHSALWRFINEGKANRNGYPVGYQIVGAMALSLPSADDAANGRAGFIDHELWVTPYAPNERYAAGDYPTLSKPGEGLPQWTKSNRAIVGTDIVAWYTIGMHHVPRAEDWPVMPAVRHDVVLRPFDFFDSNPSLTSDTTP